MMQSRTKFQMSQTQGVNVESIIGNSDVTNFVLMAEIEKELMDNPYNMISLVFLLYDVPDTALRRLIQFQRDSIDATTSTNLNMLHKWFQHAKHNPNWKHELVEALLICQLHSIVRKLGCNVPATRKYYQTDSITVKMYINPMKKALYKLCEGINSDNLLKLKKELLKFKIDTTEYDSCELVFLKLMCDKFITINQYQYNKKMLGFKMDVEKLINIVKSLPGLKKLVLEIDMLQEIMNETSKTDIEVTPIASSEHKIIDESSQRLELNNGALKFGKTALTSSPFDHKIAGESMNDAFKFGTTASTSYPSEHKIAGESMNGAFKFGTTASTSAPSEHKIAGESMNGAFKFGTTATTSYPSEHKIAGESMNGAFKFGTTASTSAPSEHKIAGESMNGAFKFGTTASTSAPSEHKVASASMNTEFTFGITVLTSASSEHKIGDESRQPQVSTNSVSKPDITAASTSSENMIVQAGIMQAEDFKDEMDDFSCLSDDIIEGLADLESDAAVYKAPKLLEV